MAEDERTNAARAALFHARPACAAALGMLAGALLYAALEQGALAYAASALLLAAAVSYRLRRRMPALFLGLCLVGVLRSAAADLPDAAPYGGEVAGRVCTEAVQTERGVRFDLSGVTIGGERVRGRLRVYLPGETAPACGETVRVRGQVAAPLERQRAMFRTARVCGTLYGYDDAFIVAEEEADALTRLYACRAAVKARILALFPVHGGEAAAMLLGDKSGVDAEAEAAFGRAGMLHLMAASGLHVSILAGALSVLVRRGRWRRFACSAIFLSVYAFLTAFSPSVLRAGIMFLIYQLAAPLRRRPDLPSAAAAAFLLIELCCPFALYGAGFQLSFLAVLGIGLLSPVLQPRMRFLGEDVSGVAAGSLAVAIATLPAAARFFGEASPMALLANVFALPLAPLFLVPALLAAGLSFVCAPLGAAAASLAQIPLRLIVGVARLGADAAVAIPAPSIAAYLLYLAALAFASPLLLGGKGRRALWSCGALALSILCWATPSALG